TANSGQSQFNLNGGPVTITSNATGATGLTVSSNVQLLSNNAMTLNINGGTLSNSDIIASSASGNSITVQSTGNLTLSGTGQIQQTGGTPGTTQFLAFGANGDSITLNNGTSQTITGGGPITISTPNINMGTGAVWKASGASSITVNAGNLTGTDLT